MDAKYINLKSVCITYVFMGFMKEEVDQKNVFMPIFCH